MLVKVNMVGQSTTLFEPHQVESLADPDQPKSAVNLSAGGHRPNAASHEAEIVNLHMAGFTEPYTIQMHMDTQAVLGRYTPNSNTQPRIDLTPYRAFDKGVSRMHAMLRRSEAGLTIEDMSSSNGTFLNGSRLQPYTAARVRSGDKLRLSQMEIVIYIGAPAAQP
jgi:hypothetical protein